MRVRTLIDEKWRDISAATVTLVSEDGSGSELRLVLDDEGHVAAFELVPVEV